MQLNKKCCKYIRLPLLLLLLLISLFLLANNLIQKQDIQRFLITKTCHSLGLDVKTGKVEIDILGAPGIIIHDVEIRLKGKTGSLFSSSVNISFSRMRLLKGKLTPVDMTFQHPVIEILESDAMALFSSSSEGNNICIPFLNDNGLKGFQIERGKVIIKGPSGIVINDLSTSLKFIDLSHSTFKISSKGKIEHQGEKSAFNIKGTISFDPDDLLKSTINAFLKTDNTPLAWIPWPVKIIDMKTGIFSSDLDITGGPEKGVIIGGSLNIKSPVFTLSKKGRSKNYNIPEFNCDLSAIIKDQSIHIDSLNMKNRDLELNLDILLDFANKRNPYFKMIAKSNFMPVETLRAHFPFPITPSWLEYDLFPMFESGTVRLDKLVLDGTFDQFKHLKAKKNNSAIGMSFSCESFRIPNMGIQVPFEGVFATVDIWDGSLNIRDLKGSFGDSIINKASLDVQGLFSGLPMFKVSMDGDFDIRELLSQRKMQIIPDSVRKQIEKFKKMDGRLSARTLIGYRKDWKIPRIMNGDFSFSNTIYHERPLDRPLRFENMGFHFYEDRDNVFSGQGLLGRMPFTVSGIVEVSGHKLAYKQASIKAKINPNELIKGSVNPDAFPFKFKNPLLCDISLEKLEDAYRYTGMINLENLVMESEKLFIHAADKGNNLSFDLTTNSKGKINLSKGEFQLGNSKIFLSGEYDLSDKKFEALKILSPGLSIGDLGLQFKGSENVLFGHLRGSLDFSFFNNNISDLQIIGNVTGNNISFIPGFLPLPISECDFRLDLSGKKGFINHGIMKFGGYPLELNGIIHGWKSVKGDLLVTSDFMDLTEVLFKDRKSSTKKPLNPSIKLLNTPDINLKLNVSKGIWRKLEFKRLNAEVIFSSEAITIKNAQAELDKGEVSVNGRIGRGRSSETDIAGTITLNNQPIDRLLDNMGFVDKGIKGSLSIKSSINLKGPLENGVLKNLSGKIDNLLMTKGLIRNSRVFLKLLDLLNIPDKFRERPQDMREKGFYFERIEGTGLIEKGILKTDDFVIKSPVFNAVGSGEENLYDQTHNIRLLIQPLTNIDYILRKIPIVGRILSEDNETIFTVAYDVEGPWSKPDLYLAPSENLKGLVGVLKRAIFTPVKIIESINDAAKNGKKRSTSQKKNNGSKKEESP